MADAANIPSTPSAADAAVDDVQNPGGFEGGAGTPLDGKVLDSFALLVRQVRDSMGALHRTGRDEEGALGIGMGSARRALNRGIASLPLEERLYLETRLGERSFSVSSDYILRLLGAKGSLTRKELNAEGASLRGFDERAVDKMRDQGLLLLSPDPDGNPLLDTFTLSAQGIAAWQEYDQRRMDQAHAFLDVLDDQEKEQLLKLITKVAESNEAKARAQA